jgi:XTP/dITP diphosphohydrolase
VTINEVWESIKAQEKQRTSPTDGLPTSLPALLYADKVLDRLAREARAGVAAATGATSTATGATSSGGSATSLGGSATSAEVGERLLEAVREARAAGVDPEQALRDAVRRLLSAT